MFRISTRYAGICGTVLGLVRLRTSPASSVYTSFPFVIGHENVRYVADAGRAGGFSRKIVLRIFLGVGERVVADPLLACEVRGIQDACGQCRQGQPQRCENATRGNLQPGIMRKIVALMLGLRIFLGLGTCASTGRSWSRFFLAHRNQVFRVPATVSDENAALMEPFCASLHPVARNRPADSDTVLVVGAGTIGLATVAALRALGSRSRIIVLARHGFQAELAQAYGADNTVLARRAGQHRQELAHELSGTLAKPVMGDPVMLGGGADLVYDCVGAASSIGEATHIEQWRAALQTGHE